MKKPRLFIIIPCYNEQEVLPITAPLFLKKLKDLIAKDKIHADSKILFVNDGSHDNTWNTICELADNDSHYVAETICKLCDDKDLRQKLGVNAKKNIEDTFSQGEIIGKICEIYESVLKKKL